MTVFARQSTCCLCLVLAVCALSAVGCVRRRMFINSNPAGALVYVDNEQIGTTPCGVDFTYYGTREIRLVKPGFETLTVNQPIPTPWYEFPPLDFVSENLMPTKIRDNRSVIYNLSPQLIVPSQELIARGEQLRQETLRGTVLPASATSPALPPGAVPTGPLVPAGPAATPAPQGPAFAPPPATTTVNPPPVVLPPPVNLPTTAPPNPPVVPPTTTTPITPQRGRPLVSPPLR